MNTIVLADFENFEDYKAIKMSQAFPTLEHHRAALAGAKRDLEKQGYNVIIETCDRAGYEHFLKISGALNTPQNVAAYVVMKHGNQQDIPRPELKHINAEIHREN